MTEIFDDVAGGEDHIVASDVDDQLVAFAAAGRERIREHYQWDQVATDYEVVLSRLARSRVPV